MLHSLLEFGSLPSALADGKPWYGRWQTFLPSALGRQSTRHPFLRQRGALPSAQYRRTAKMFAVRFSISRRQLAPDGEIYPQDLRQAVNGVLCRLLADGKEYDVTFWKTTSPPLSLPSVSRRHSEAFAVCQQTA